MTAGSQTPTRHAASPPAPPTELALRLELVYPVGLAAVMVYLGFEAGGYFAGTTGWVAAGLACALGLTAIARGRPPQGVTRPMLVAAVALAAFAVWTLVSGEWSGAPARALIEFDRVLLYLLALLLFASARFPVRVLEGLPAAVAFAAVVLCAAGVLIRTMPDAWPFSLPPLTAKRLDYPLSYENALGALAGLGLVFSLHLAASTQRRVATRILAVAGLPVLAAALTLTFSRGAIVATVLGLVAYLALGWSRGLLTAVCAAAPPVAGAVVAAYDANLLATLRARSPPALDQGEDLALLLGGAVLGAAVLLALLLPLERRLRRVTLRGPRLVAIVAIALAGAVTLLVATGAPGRLESLREGFLEPGRQDGEPLTRERLTSAGGLGDLGGQSRVKYWKVGLDAFEDAPVRGNGAGTYARIWARDRPIEEDLTEGHSLYVEVLAELGVVGGLLLSICLGTIVIAVAGGVRGPTRPLYAALLAATLLWLVHAGLDWDWEMPVLTLWLFAMGGCALTAKGRPLRVRRRYRMPGGLLLGAACFLVAATPATVAISQARLDRSARSLRSGDCERAERSAQSALSALAARAEPYEILAYCASARGDTALAVSRMELAIERDPDSWELYYGLAVIRGAGGLDPRPAARTAHRLSPRRQLTRAALRRFSTDRPAAWRREAGTAPLPLLAEPR